MVDPMHFDGMAGGYGLARPPYPGALWRDVFATGLVAPERRALDLGAGSGQATSELLARGMEVVAAEPGESLAGILEARLPRATVMRSRAEDLVLDRASFDLVVAATAIHWMDLGIVLPMVHETLTAEGRLLVWRNVFGDPDAEITPFRREIERIVERRGTSRPGDPEDVDRTAAKIAETHLFVIDHVHRYRWSIELTAGQIHALFTTFSDWSESEVAQATSAAEMLGGTVIEHYTSWLINARPCR
ncbi:MAG TPA: class I SAM-dependent methyltransferase [Microbacterium sp.]|nr:class I SAM-dependent methyltransferase [Microbacterium sp.]